MEKIPDHPPRKKVELLREPPLWLPSQEAIAFTVIADKLISCTVNRKTLVLLAGQPLEKPRNVMDAFYAARLSIVSAIEHFLNSSSSHAADDLEVTAELLQAAGVVPDGDPAASLAGKKVGGKKDRPLQ